MINEQRALLDRAERAFEAARILFERGLYDDAASRAYYSMFYIAQAFLRTQGLAFSSHKATIAAFGKHIAKPGMVPVTLHRDLIEAQDLRQLGDYAVTVIVSAERTSEQLERARRFLEAARRHLSP